MIPEYAITSNNIEDFIIEIKLPKLSTEVEGDLLNEIYGNLQNFKSWIILSLVNILPLPKSIGIGLSLFTILDEQHKKKIVQMIDRSNLLLDYEDIIIGFEKYSKAVAKHSDSFRNFTLLYILKGNSIINFYNCDEFGYNESFIKTNLAHTVRLETHKWYLLNNILFHEVTDIEDDESLQIYFNLSCRFYDFEDAAQNWKRLLKNNDII